MGNKHPQFLHHPQRFAANIPVVNNFIGLYRLVADELAPRYPTVVVTGMNSINTNTATLVEALSAGVHKSNIFFLENHLDMQKELSADNKKFFSVLFPQLQYEKAKRGITCNHTNILVIGPQHSGKSCLVNGAFKYFNPKLSITPCPVDCQAQVGTVYYDKVKLNSEFNMFDTCGRYLEQGANESDVKFINKLMQGVQDGTNLVQDQWLQQPPVPENQIHCVVIVIEAALLERPVL